MRWPHPAQRAARAPTSPRPAPGLASVRRSSSQAGAKDLNRGLAARSCPPGPVHSSSPTPAGALVGRCDSPAVTLHANTRRNGRNGGPALGSADREAAGGPGPEVPDRLGGRERAPGAAPRTTGHLPSGQDSGAGHPGRVCGSWRPHHPCPGLASPPTPSPSVGPPAAESIPWAPLSSAWTLYHHHHSPGWAARGLVNALH